MTPEEFPNRFRLRTTQGPQTCTGENPCVCSAVTSQCAWYCRALVCTSGRRVWLGGNSDHIVCDRWAAYRCTPFPSYTPSSSSVE